MEYQYKLRIFCCTHQTTEEIPSFIYSVLIFQWELKNIEQSVISITSIFDKVFTISEFISSGMRKYDRRINSILLPFDVDKYNIKEYRNNINCVKYYYTMDWGSFVSRKNPDVLISAFKKLKLNLHDICLTIKFNNISSMELFERYGDLSDYGIKFITNRLPHDEYLKFLMYQDILVSPHKSEGFGRVIGEAIMHGHFVVATKYGGVLDYLNSDNSILVRGELKNLLPSEYFSFDGNKWMSISEDDLVTAMFSAYNKIKENKINFIKNKEIFEKKYNLNSFYKDIIRKLNGK
jgi:glycosyltransferase involved in cell wall biosynthesis